MSQIPTWYVYLNKPLGTPPNSLFGPVWTTLYIMMGVSAWRVWKKHGFEKTPFIFFGIQFFLNFIWSFIFFGAHQLGWAFLDILLLEITLMITLKLFWKRDTLAGALLIPYVLWIAYAMYLNISIWRLNA